MTQRWRLSSLCATMLIALCLYAGLNPPQPSVAQLVTDPGAWAGREVELYVETRVDSIIERGFVLRQQEATIVAFGVKLPADAVGKFVSLRARVTESGQLEAFDVHVARGRRLKMAVSLLALLPVCLLLWGYVRPGRHGLRCKHA